MVLEINLKETAAEIMEELHNDENAKSNPFQRKKSLSEENDKKFVKEVMEVLNTLNEDITEVPDINDEMKPTETLIQIASEHFAKRWKLKDGMSEISFRGLLLVLEQCLSYELSNQNAFAYFVDALGYHTVLFWRKAIHFLFESDMQHGTKYRDALLFSLALYDVNFGRNRLREVFAAVPGLQNSLLAKSSKRFEEAFSVMMNRRSSFSNGNVSNGSLKDQSKSETSLLLEDSLKNLQEGIVDDDVDSEVANVMDDDKSTEDEKNSIKNGGKLSSGYVSLEEQNGEKDSPTFRDRNSSISNSYGRLRSGSGSTGASGGNIEHPDTIITGGLASGHFQERVINVSNAPPVSLKKKLASGIGTWEIGQGSGGLVSCCDPVMSKDSSNIWLACFGPDVPFNAIGTPASCNTPLPVQTNSLGLPITRPVCTEVHLSMLQDPVKDEDEMRQEVVEQMGLLGVLRNYNKENYKLNPVVIAENDYNTYYGGISNGLLWPALHNLPEFIVKEYDDSKHLREHWNAYVRVNYQFALNAVRNSRSQDFLWIHDYHLILTGLIIQSLDPNLEVGFFLHIPFQPPKEFFTTFKIVGEAVMRGLLRFTKVGFQTNRDREFFVDIVRQRFPSAKIHYNQKIDKHTITFEGFTSSLGVFPVSIKNEDFLTICKNDKVQENARQIKEKIMGKREGKLFFSVERFDYTKGINEKLKAYLLYFRRHPDRIGKDTFFQVAVTNRRTVDTYRQYQDECLELAKKVTNEIHCENDPDWKPLIFQMDGLTRPVLVAHYLAMNVGVVTPRQDGMNLVAKEMLICNPKSSLVLSSGAGTEVQFSIAGFYTDLYKCYHRVADIYNAESFADILYDAALEEQSKAEENSSRLNEFLLLNDIDKWSENFLDPSWTHDVIQSTTIKSLKAFYNLMFQTRTVRRQIVQRVLKGNSIRPHFAISLRNARISLEQSCEQGGNVLHLTATDVKDSKTSATFDVSHEIVQLEIDEAFLNYVQSDAYDNLEQFLQDLSKYHPSGSDEFNREIEEVITLVSRGDHFQYFFTDRDGTLSAYACSYPSSIQGAYSGVIQATFAQRCTQYSAIITSAPMQNVGILDVRVMPDKYYCYGASCGREWYVDSSKNFKDDSISASELELLEKLADRIAQLLENPDYAQFAWIGSGLQRHYGHITVAKQDVYKSVDELASYTWFGVICDLVAEFDPMGSALHVHDSDTDIKIYLRAKLSGKIFTKGHGLRLFAQNMNLKLEEGNILVCADSETDLPMLREVLMINPQNVYTVWVTKNEELKQKVIDLCEQVRNFNYVFPSSPLVLLGAMAQATIREIKIRPSTTDAFDFDEN